MAEYVCGDGRMSVNGICPASSYPGYQNPAENIAPAPVITNQINQEGGGAENNFTKDYSKDVKSNFQWDFDKVGNKIENFNNTIKDNVTSFNSYVSEKLGVDNIAKNAAIGLALGPYAVPLAIGKSVFSQYQTNKNNKITDRNLKIDQGIAASDNYDMMTYDNADGSGGYTGGFDSSTQNYNDPYSPGDTE